MLCIELPVANLDMDTTTFTWTGKANHKCVSFLVSAGARVTHKYSNVDMFMCIRPLNSLALNDPNKFWSKKPGQCDPLSWAHKLRGRDARSRWWLCSAKTRQHSWCHYHRSISPWCVDRVSKAMDIDICRTSKITSRCTTRSIISSCSTKKEIIK